MASDAKRDDWYIWKLAFAAWLAWVGFGRDAWYSKFRYSVQYGVHSSDVTKTKEPRDCERLTAPLGGKGCHYEIRVQTVRAAFDQGGKPIISNDGGATWFRTDGVEEPGTERPYNPSAAKVSSVSLTWEKVENEQGRPLLLFVC